MVCPVPSATICLSGGLLEATGGLPEGAVPVCMACGSDEQYLTRQDSGAYACSICWSIVEVKWIQADG